MPSESVLKVLIALNAIQMFITLLLVATMASAGLTSQSTASLSTGYAPAGVTAGDDPFGAYGSGPPPGQPPPPAGDEAAPGGEAIPPGDGLEAGSGAPAGGAPPPGARAQGAPDNPATLASQAAGQDRVQVIMRTYLNLVSRRLQLAASDAGVDPAAWIPTESEIDAAVNSGDASSEAFTAALDKLRPGYAQLEMDFPSPPAPRPSEESSP